MSKDQAMVPAEAPKAAAGRMVDPEFFGRAFAAMAAEWMEKGGQAQILDGKVPKEGPQAAYIDPWEVLSWYGARLKPTSLAFPMLRDIARACKPIAAAVATRQNQVVRFCRLARKRGDVGFRVNLRDPDAKPRKAAQKRMREIEQFIFQMGQAPAVHPDGLGPRPGMVPMIKMIVRDSLVLDAVAIEPRRTLRGDLYDIWPVDAGTIRLAGPRYKPQIAGSQGMHVAYVQDHQGTVLAEFEAEDLFYEIRNPRTDIQANGYGFSELEILVETVSALLNAEEYNRRYFTQNSLPEGIVSIVGNLSQANLDSFKRAWNAMVSGVANAWKVPIIATPDGKGVTFTPFKATNHEMQFHEYLDWLVTVTCAVYQIDREEIGFAGKEAGTGSSLNDGGNQSTLQHSMSKGFYPLMTFLEHVINTRIVWNLDDEFIFEWAGLEPERESQLWTMNKEKLQAGVMTARQYWRENDIQDDYPHMMWPDCPPNPTLQGIYMQESGIMNQGSGGYGDDEDGDQGDQDQQDQDQQDEQPPPGGDQDGA